jgi:hypothetical protein
VAHHLAQLNVARAVAPLDGPELAEFTAALEPVNAIADAAPGFVWRLEDETDAPGATAIRPYADPWMLVNLSVWTSIDALWDFVYAGGHLEVMRRRREWFTRLTDPHLVLWWIPAGSLPTLDEAIARLEHLREHGPTPNAFTFKQARRDPRTT